MPAGDVPVPSRRRARKTARFRGETGLPSDPLLMSELSASVGRRPLPDGLADVPRVQLPGTGADRRLPCQVVDDLRLVFEFGEDTRDGLLSLLLNKCRVQFGPDVLDIGDDRL